MALTVVALLVGWAAGVALYVLSYIALSGLYTVWLKRLVIVDIFVLASLYGLRVLLGGVASGHPASSWMLAICGFFFLSLALVKRVTEIEGAPENIRRGYTIADAPVLKAMGVGAAFASSLVLALYVQSDVATRSYGAPAWLWVLPAAVISRCRRKEALTFGHCGRREPGGLSLLTSAATTTFRLSIFAICFFILNAMIVVTTPFHAATAVFRAGAAMVDITPTTFPIRTAGNLTLTSANKTLDPLNVRALVLDDGRTQVAIAVVDSCMVDRETMDAAKAAPRRVTGIPTDRMLIAATHTHSAPAAYSCHGNDVEPAYVELLIQRTAAAII